MGVAARGNGRRNLLVTVHNCHYAQKKEGLGNPLLASYYCLCIKLLPLLCRKFIAVSTAVKEDLMRLGIKEERIVVINNGVTLAAIGDKRNSFSIRTQHSLPPDGFVVGTVGRLEPEKGHAILLETIKRLEQLIPELRVIIVGEGSLLGYLIREAKRLGIDGRVIFCGYQPHIGDLLSAMDVFVLPSFAEGFGLALVEAMARAKPIVATRVGGICDIVEHGETGLLVPPKDPEGLSHAILRLCEDGTLRDKMGRAGRERVKRLFSIEKTVKNTVGLYEEILAENSDRP